MTELKITVEAVRLNLAGFRQLRKSEGAKAMVNAAAGRIAAACGDGYVAEESPGRNRARAIVHPDTTEARIDSLKNLTLLRNLRAGRG